MMHLIRLVVLAFVGVWTAIRTAETAFAAWVRRETRARDLTGLTWA
jgi:hypothetical protein